MHASPKKTGFFGLLSPCLIRKLAARRYTAPGEVWKPLPGFEQQYELSNMGRIWNLTSGMFIKNQIDQYGKSRIIIKYGHPRKSVAIPVYKAVAIAFVPNPNGYSLIKHLDKCLFNNHHTNLAWVADEEGLIEIDKIHELYGPPSSVEPTAHKKAGAQSVLHRITKPIFVQFRLRHKQDHSRQTIHPIQFSIARANAQRVHNATPLLVRITIHGHIDGGFSVRMPDSLRGNFSQAALCLNNYGSVLTIDPTLWNARKGCLIGDSEEVTELNNALLGIKLKIQEIYRLQLERYVQQTGPVPTTETVKKEYLAGVIALNAKGRRARQQDSLVGTFDMYYQKLLTEQDTELALSESSLDVRRITRVHLVNFLAYEKTPYLEPNQVTKGWARRFYSWLTQHARPSSKSSRVYRMESATAQKYIGVIRMALGSLVEQDLLPANPLIGLQLPKSKKKPVIWLSPEQVEALWKMELTEPVGATAFWFKVIILTGLDYSDAVRYVQDRSTYERIGIGGRKIVINRGKNESECHIPFTDQLAELLEGSIPWAYGLESVNINLKKLAPLLGFSHPLTTKVGRKTAGAMWLLEGYSIHEISRFLGHSSIAMTESYYVKTSALTADRAMQRMKGNLEQPDTFLRAKS